MSAFAGQTRAEPADPLHSRCALFLPVHHLWQGYMSELLQLPKPPNLPSTSATAYKPNSAAMHAKLVKADYHGALITGECSFLSSSSYS